MLSQIAWSVAVAATGIGAQSASRLYCQNAQHVVEDDGFVGLVGVPTVVKV